MDTRLVQTELVSDLQRAPRPSVRTWWRVDAGPAHTRNRVSTELQSSWACARLVSLAQTNGQPLFLADNQLSFCSSLRSPTLVQMAHVISTSPALIPLLTACNYHAADLCSLNCCLIPDPYIPTLPSPSLLPFTWGAFAYSTVVDFFHPRESLEYPLLCCWKHLFLETTVICRVLF